MALPLPARSAIAALSKIPGKYAFDIEEATRVCVELELELIQAQTATTPVLRGEVGARAWRVSGQARGGWWGGANAEVHVDGMSRRVL